MPKRLSLEFSLPDEVVAFLREDELAAKAKESLVMELLREHRISQGKAAELLGIGRHSLYPIMAKYQVAVVDLSPEELREELQKPLPSQ